MSPLISTTDTTPNDWQYVSEGGATIVFSYTGFNPHFTGTVLRLRKTKTSDADANWQHDCATEFQTTIMERLISPQFLPRLTPVRVERAWLEDLTDLRDSDRPHDRRQKDRIDVSRKIAVLATDLIGTDGLAAEIKVVVYLVPLAYQLNSFLDNSQNGLFCLHQHTSRSKHVQLRRRHADSVCTNIGDLGTAVLSRSATVLSIYFQEMINVSIRHYVTYGMTGLEAMGL
jgi:hypothetical protein